MNSMPALAPDMGDDVNLSRVLAGLDMLTVRMTLRQAGHELMLAMPRAEWLKLVSDFVKMPADERQRVGVSIREATAVDPFPVDGSPVAAKDQPKCDVFLNDCVLLAALSEALGGSAGERIFLDTAVDHYKVVPGLPQFGRSKGRFN
jgi:hypothetical protein